MPEEHEIQRRFFECRVDPETRRLSGTAMRYGDVAKLYWGQRERFMPGAFGNLDGADVILNVQHDRTRPIARTGGGGLTLRDTSVSLEVEATLPDTREANDVITNIRAGILRGMSVEFRLDSSDVENGVTVIREAELRGIAVVDRGAYPKALIKPRSSEMDESEIRTAIAKGIEEALAAKSDDGPDPVEIARQVTEAVTTSVAAQVDAALEARDKAEEEKRAAEKAKADAEAKAVADREAAEETAERRADLLTLIAPVLPEGTERRGKTNKELLVIACGDEVPDADKRSEDYLLAKVEGIVERRAAKPAPAPAPRKDVPAPQVRLGGGFSVLNAVQERQNGR